MLGGFKRYTEGDRLTPRESCPELPYREGGDICISEGFSTSFKVVLAYWKVKTPCHANGVFINNNIVKFKPKKIKFISKKTHYLLAHYNIPQ